MPHKLAIDLGTTNTVLACWDDNVGAPQIIAIPSISTSPDTERPALVPSLVYVRTGQTGAVVVGQEVREQGLDMQQNNRLFRNFKRGIITSPPPAPRRIDDTPWSDSDAGRTFVRQLIGRLPFASSEIEQLVLTAPIASFEGYLAWLNEAVGDLADERVRIIDESTAAALGYAVTQPGAIVLVLDFGGGTLDLSLVQLPENREKTGGILKRLLRGGASQHAARVIGKAGRVIGGSDVDQWMLADTLKRLNLTVSDLSADYPRALTACEQTKIALSSAESAVLELRAGGSDYDLPYTRADLETLLQQNGFHTALRRVVDKVMYIARQRGIFKEDIHYVLLVGGMSLMPCVQRTLAQYFTDMAVRADKPFTAVAEGALQIAAGYGLEDYLAHSYGLRHLDPETGTHQYDEIVPMGSSYPTETPVEVILSAAHSNQTLMEFMIGEIDSDAISMIEVHYENGQAVFVARADEAGQQVVPINEPGTPDLFALLDPPGIPGEDRVKAEFTVDARRRLRLTATDLKTGRLLVQDAVVAALH